MAHMVNIKIQKRVAAVIGLVLVLSVILFVEESVAYELEWVYTLRFQLGLIPFEKPAFVVIATPLNGGEKRHPVESDREILKIMDFIIYAARSERKYVEVNVSQKLPSFEMGWSQPAEISLFRVKYKVWRLELWMTEFNYSGFSPKSLYLRTIFQDADNAATKLFQIEDPELTMKAFRLLMEAYEASGGNNL